MRLKTKHDHTSFPWDVQEDSTRMDLHLFPNTAFIPSNQNNIVTNINALLHIYT